MRDSLCGTGSCIAARAPQHPSSLEPIRSSTFEATEVSVTRHASLSIEGRNLAFRLEEMFYSFVVNVSSFLIR